MLLLINHNLWYKNNHWWTCKFCLWISHNMWYTNNNVWQTCGFHIISMIIGGIFTRGNIRDVQCNLALHIVHETLPISTWTFAHKPHKIMTSSKNICQRSHEEINHKHVHIILYVTTLFLHCFPTLFSRLQMGPFAVGVSKKEKTT